MASFLECGRFRLSLDRPLVMGILNVTPDSFSDGGQYASPELAVEQAQRMIAEGADLIDIGAESTRPGAEPVDPALELRRLSPVLEALVPLGVPISVDTRRPEVMRAALAMGADCINDVQALQAEGALEAVRESNCAVCLMHMQGSPGTMQTAPAYQDVVAEVGQFLRDRLQIARREGLAANRLMVDPGIGFGKTLEQNLALIGRLSELVPEVAVLIGLSRKRMVGDLTGRPLSERLAGSLGGAMAAVARGASVVRVHDVAATVDALAVWRSVTSGHNELRNVSR
ncbi:MAG: dihydropteroate synthase [Betaproteobacteria bacterium]|nr:dihydropteroate synthase [Betaproteobacteria bacterium]